MYLIIPKRLWTHVVEGMIVFGAVVVYEKEIPMYDWRSDQPRYHMWNRLIPGIYDEDDKETRQMMKKNWCIHHYYADLHAVQPNKEDIKMANCNLITYPTCSLGTIVSGACNTFVAKQEEKVNAMHCYQMPTNTTVQLNAPAEYNAEREAREHLRERLHVTFHAKDRELSKKFGLMDEAAPRTTKDMVARIKEGKFTLSKYAEDQEDDEGCDYNDMYDVVRHIRWRDPAVKEDRAGYKAAYAELSKAHDAAKDAIMVGTPAEGLKALQEFEATA